MVDTPTPHSYLPPKEDPIGPLYLEPDLNMRLSRLADYGVVVMSHVAGAPERLHNAAQLSEMTRLPLPTVKKLLKLLAKGGLLQAASFVSRHRRYGRVSTPRNRNSELCSPCWPGWRAGCIKSHINALVISNASRYLASDRIFL